MSKLILFLLFSGNVCLAQDVATPGGDETIYSMAELHGKPEYPGGTAAFYGFVQKNIRIPEVEDDLDVSIYVSFVINKDGTISDINVPRDPGYGLTAEVIRLMKSNKELWKPGKLNGNAVRVKYQFPIKIRVKNPQRKKDE